MLCGKKKKKDLEGIFTKLLNLMFDIAVLNIEIGNWAPAPEVMSDPSLKLCGNLDSWICGFSFPASKQSCTTAQRWNGSKIYLYKIICI